jgi:hypothetical protein
MGTFMHDCLTSARHFRVSLAGDLEIISASRGMIGGAIVQIAEKVEWMACNYN